MHVFLVPMATLNGRSGFPARDVCNEQICGILVYSSSTLVAYIVLSVILVIGLFYVPCIAVSSFRARIDARLSFLNLIVRN